MTHTLTRISRALMILTVVVALLGGLGSGLARLGWQTDALSRDWMMMHGALMISGFLGTLICLERAVALSTRVRWAMLVPAINALGALLLLLQQDAFPARLLLMLGSGGLVALFLLMLRIHPSRDVAIMGLGAVLWWVGNVRWLNGAPIYSVVHLWTAFLLLTIVGERLELSRVRRLSLLSERLLVGSVAVYAAGVMLSVIQLGAGIRLLGIGAILMAAWLLRYDVTQRTIRQTGLPRYIAACLILGYGWLAFGGLIAVWKGAVYAGADYAVILHAFLLGFVFSMIFGHMPMILPALSGLKVTYTRLFYVPLGLLHGSLVYRMVGNLTRESIAMRWGGLWNVSAVLLFMGLTAGAVLHANVFTPKPETRARR